MSPTYPANIRFCFREDLTAMSPKKRTPWTPITDVEIYLLALFMVFFYAKVDVSIRDRNLSILIYAERSPKFSPHSGCDSEPTDISLYLYLKRWRTNLRQKLVLSFGGGMATVLITFRFPLRFGALCNLRYITYEGNALKICSSAPRATLLCAGFRLQLQSKRVDDDVRGSFHK